MGSLLGDAEGIVSALGHLQASVEINGKRVQLTPQAVREATGGTTSTGQIDSKQ